YNHINSLQHTGVCCLITTPMDYKHIPQDDGTRTGSTGSTIEAGKTTAIIAYITVIGLVIALIMNGDKKNPCAAYHIRQSLGLMLTSFAVSVVSMIPFVGWLLGIVAAFALLYMWIMGIMGAANGREK